MYAQILKYLLVPENNQYLKIQVTRTPFQNHDFLKINNWKGFCLPVFHISTMFMINGMI